MAGGKRLYALVLCTGGALGQQKRGADIVLQQLQRAVEKFRAGNALGADPLAFLQHAHAVTVRSGPQIAAADPDVIRLLAVILRIFQALGIRLFAYLCQRKGKVLQLIRKAGVGIKVSAAVQDATNQEVEHQLLRAALAVDDGVIADGFQRGVFLADGGKQAHALLFQPVGCLYGLGGIAGLRGQERHGLIGDAVAVTGHQVGGQDIFDRQAGHVADIEGERIQHRLRTAAAGEQQQVKPVIHNRIRD